MYRLIRITAADQLFYIVTKCSVSTPSFISFISLLFSAVDVSTCVHVYMYVAQVGFKCMCVLQSVAKDHAPTSGEFFRLLAR